MLITALWLASSAFAGDHLQLAPGDELVFSNTFGEEVSISVDDTLSNWRHWSHFPGTGELWIRPGRGQQERVLHGSLDTGVSGQLVDFNRPVGSSWAVAFSACDSEATLAAVDEVLTTPAGTFTGLTRVDFTGPCADAGLGSIWFSADVGPVRWTEGNISGIVQHDLIRATVGGEQWPALPAVGVQGGASTTEAWINMMPGTGTNPPTQISAQLTLTNGSTTNMVFQFNSGQQFEIEILAPDGQVVSRWSRGMFFTEAIELHTVAPGETLQFSGQVELTDIQGVALNPGSYTVRVSLRSAAAAGTDHTVGSRQISIQSPLKIDHAF